MKITKHEALVLTAHTGIVFTSTFHEFHVFAEELLNKPVYLHQFASKEIWKDLRSAVSKEATAIFAAIEYIED